MPDRQVHPFVFHIKKDPILLLDIGANVNSKPEIVEEVEYNGIIDSTTSHINSLITAYNITKYYPKWKFEGAIMPSGKI